VRKIQVASSVLSEYGHEEESDYEEKGGEVAEDEGKDLGCNKVGVDVDDAHGFLVAIHGFKVAQQRTTQSSDPIPQEVEQGEHRELAESREEAEMLTVPKRDTTEKDVIDQLCQNHINMVMEQEMQDNEGSACDNRGEDQEQSTYNVDLEVAEAAEDEGKDLGCNKVGVDVDDAHGFLVAIHGFKVAQQRTTQSSDPIPQEVEQGEHRELAESREEAEMLTVPKRDTTEKDVIDQLCQNHINMVMEQEMHDNEESACDNRGNDQEQSTYNVDLEVNVTKVEIEQLRKCWDKENAVCAQHYKETDHPIVIKWHNVNGIGSFIRHLRQEGSDYFKPKELYPDIFIILEAKVSAARKLSLIHI
jgi:hypothetical protein